VNYQTDSAKAKHTIRTLDRPKKAVITSKYYIGPLYKTAAHTLALSKNATALLYYAARRPVLVIYS